MTSISKILSANDVGATGAHQAGILVPKESEILLFFPSLLEAELNPRALLSFEDDYGDRWEFAFIYYNNLFFGGTRNEYRLTRMTKFFRAKNLKPGDELIMLKEGPEMRRIRYRRGSSTSKSNVLRLGSQWRIVSY